MHQIHASLCDGFNGFVCKRVEGGSDKIKEMEGARKARLSECHYEKEGERAGRAREKGRERERAREQEGERESAK